MAIRPHTRTSKSGKRALDQVDRECGESMWNIGSEFVSAGWHCFDVVATCFSGICDDWFHGRDRHVIEVAKSVNGPLMEVLARKTKYQDSNCIEQMRQGHKSHNSFEVACYSLGSVCFQVRLCTDT